MAVRNPSTLIIGAALLLAPLLAALAGATPPAGAAPKTAPAKADKAKPEKAPPKPKLDVAAVQKALESGDEAKTLEALDTVSKNGDPAGAALVEALLGRGASVTVLSRAIETLGILGQPSSGAALAPYAQHRTPELRHAALRALVATKAPNAGDVLRHALHGSDASQRAIAARGLGQLNVRAAVPELFTVLPKDVAEAAQSLGVLCVADECEKLVGFLGRLRFEVMESAIVPLLLRPQADVSDDLKLRLIERLRRMATQPANQLLQTALAKFPPDGSPKVKLGIERALKGYSVTEEGQ
ncbi:MAG TPA: HEAT repeat domain-containing protein [Polyangiaceae bacterium]|nr:HEAT repeat domain-containing protein [Polyangiaceae bacterium]